MRLNGLGARRRSLARGFSLNLFSCERASDDDNTTWLNTLSFFHQGTNKHCGGFGVYCVDSAFILTPSQRNNFAVKSPVPVRQSSTKPSKPLAFYLLPPFTSRSPHAVLPWSSQSIVPHFTQSPPPLQNGYLLLIYLSRTSAYWPQNGSCVDPCLSPALDQTDLVFPDVDDRLITTTSLFFSATPSHCSLEEIPI